MPATLYHTADPLTFDVGSVRKNKNERTASAFFANRHTKVQLGDFDDDEPWVVKALLTEEQGGGQKGIRLEAERGSPPLRWFKDMECTLVHEAQKNSPALFKQRLETFEVQDLYQSVRNRTTIDMRLADDVKVYLFDEDKPTQIDFADVKVDVLCIPIVQLVGVWIDDGFGLVVKVTDLMCFEQDEEEAGPPPAELFAHAASADLHKAEWGTSGADSPVESMWGASLYPKKMKITKR